MTFLALNTFSAASSEQPNLADAKASHGQAEHKESWGARRYDGHSRRPQGDCARRDAGGRDSRQCAAASGIDVLVERDAGAGALLPTRTYTDVGARVDDAEQLIRRGRRRPRNSRTRCPATRTAASGPAPLRTVASLHNNRARRRTRRCLRHRGEFGTCCCTRSAAPSRWIHSPRRQTSPGRRRTT